MSNRWIELLAAIALATGVALCGEQKRASGPVTPGAKTGAILCEYFKDIDGGTVDNLVANPAFPNKPSESILLTSFEIPSDVDVHYGTAVRGFLHPPATGNYTFWIASDDASELWLSPTDNPKDKIKLCQMSAWCPPRAWETTPEQKSKPVPLVAGRTYYIEALHKQGEGGDNMAVGWELPDGKMERPILGAHLSPAGIPKPPPPVTVTIQGVLPRTPGFHKCMSKVTGVPVPFDFPFLLYVPNDFGKVASPALLFLHGVGECGTDLEGVYGNGPHGHIRNDAKLREKMPFLVIGPQCAPGKAWNQRPVTRATVALLDEILKQYGNYVDKDRVCMTGLSLGGAGTWQVALEAPDRFAAIVPSDPRSVTPDLAAERLKDLPIWIIAGAEDGDFTKGAKEMFDALKNNVPKPQLILVPNCGHGAWSYYYPKWEFYQWLLKWKRQPARVAALAAAEKKLAPEPAKPAPPAKIAEVAAKPEPAKPEPAKPAPPEPAKPAVPAKPVEVAKAPVVVAAKPPVVATPAPTPQPAKLPDAPKPAPAVAVVNVPAKPPENPQIDAPVIGLKNASPTTITVAPKPAAVAVSVRKAPPPEPEPEVIEEETHHAPRDPFPYAAVSLLCALGLLGAAGYFLTTEED